jgi:pimeloyl-ACP methyl ester carboxylesterase
MRPIIKSARLPNGISLPYAEQGDLAGQPVIFVHAIADSWRSFEPLLSHLPASIHAFAPTQRGHGDASRPASGYRPQDFATDLGAFMDVIELQAATIVGGSSGGFITRRFALEHPERVLGLALLGSPASLSDKPEVVEMWDSTFSKMTDPIDPGLVRNFAEGTLARPVPREFLETMVQENLKVPAHVWRETFKGLFEDRTTEELGKIKAPTLILWGDGDSIIPRSDQEQLATSIARAKLLVYPGAGHAVYWEDPERVAAHLVEFVEGLPAHSDVDTV